MGTTTTELEWLAFALQTNDSAFPTGGYAHSLGLETVVELGVVKNEATLLAYLRAHLLGAMERYELPLLLAAHGAAAARDLDELVRIDNEVHARKPARELRDASTQMGRRRLEMLCKLRPTPLLENLRTAIDAGRAPGHHLCVFAAAYAAWPFTVCAMAWFHQAVVGPCMAAMKLIRIGQDGSQRVLAACMQEAAARIEAAAQVDGPGWFDPLTEIASMRHEVAGERLFIS